MNANRIIEAFERLKADTPRSFYSALGYGDDEVDIMHPFISGSYELGLVAGAKYALEHLARVELKDQIIEQVRKMRQLQRDYFRTRDNSICQASKDVEKHVDKLLFELETPNLFEQ